MVLFCFVEFLEKVYMKLSEIVAGVENLTQTFLEHRGFPQCIRAIDGKDIPIRRPNQNYADYSNRKGFTFINAQAHCDYLCCFLDVLMSGRGAFMTQEYFSSQT